MKRVKKRWQIWLALALLCMGLPAEAAEKVSVGDVVVTATRYEQQITDLPANISVITEDTIKNSTAQSIPDLLKTQAGVLVNDITGNRRTFTVDLRGFGETATLNTLVLVDGRRINEADLSGTDWAVIPLERVSRIEIIRGGRGSILYGDSATGGVINIITREGAEGMQGTMEAAAGSYGTYKAGASVQGGTKDVSLHLSGNYLTSDGYRDNSKTEAKDLGMNAAYYFRDILRLDFSAGYHKDHTGLPGALKESDFAAGHSRTSTVNPEDFSATKDYYLKLSPELTLCKDVVVRVDASYRSRNFNSFSSFVGNSNFLGTSDISTTSLSPQIIVRKSMGTMRNVLTAGVDYSENKNDIVNDLFSSGKHSLGIFALQKKDTGYYAHDELGLSDSLRLSGGYRHDEARFSFTPSTPDSVTMKKDAYTAGVNYTFYKKSYAYASYSRSFRYPVLDELYSFFTNTINASLLPQTSNDYELGVRHYLTDGLFVHANVFRIDTDREIIYNPVSYQNENLDGKTRRDGVELSFDARATDRLTLRGSFTYLAAKIKDGTFADKKIPNVPAHKATLDVTYQITKEASAGLNGIYVGERPFISDFANDFSKQDSYLVLNAKLSYRWKSVKAYLDLNNLTNKRYAEYGVLGGYPIEKAFYPSPGRNVLAGLSVSF